MPGSGTTATSTRGRRQDATHLSWVSATITGQRDHDQPCPTYLLREIPNYDYVPAFFGFAPTSASPSQPSNLLHGGMGETVPAAVAEWTPPHTQLVSLCRL